VFADVTHVPKNTQTYISAWKTYHKNPHVQMVFLVMNTWRSKHAEDTKGCIKTLIKKTCILLVHIAQFYHNARYKKQSSTYCCLAMTNFFIRILKSETAKNSLCCLTYRVTCWLLVVTTFQLTAHCICSWILHSLRTRISMCVENNIVEFWRNHCCHVKAACFKYYVCVCVCVCVWVGVLFP
jgi:hypothetical protein